MSKGEEEEKGRGRELAEAEDEAAAASVDEGSSKECAQATTIQGAYKIDFPPPNKSWIIL